MSAITPEAVLRALSYVEEPDLKKDLVTLNMIEDVQVDGRRVAFTVVLTTPACPLKDLIRTACERAIHTMVDKDAEVTVNMTSRVTTARQQGGAVLPRVKNIVAIASGKGGVGKSTVTANLAIALARAGAKVGLVDADISGPSMPVMFGVEHEKPRVLAGPDGRNLIQPIVQYGVKLISIGFLTPAELPENKYYLFGEGGGGRLAEAAGVPLLGQVPLVQSIRESGDRGKPAILNGAESPVAAQAFTELAEEVARQVSIRNVEMATTKVVEFRS